MSANGTIVGPEHRRKDCLGSLGAVELHPAYCLSALGGPKNAAEEKRTRRAETTKVNVYREESR